MINRLGTNPTQFLGMIAFAAAAAACLVAAYRPTARDRRAWMFLALINGVFLIEVFFGFRHRIHDMANSILTAQGTYGDRASLQRILILVVALLAFALACCVVWPRFTNVGSKLAASTGIAILALFAIETVSLHSLDAVLYRPIGPALLVGWIWIIACTLTVSASFLDKTRR
jgi:hypothetical protein